MRASHVAFLLGLGLFGIIYAYAPAPADREAKLAEVTRILAVTRRDVAPDATQSSYAFRSFAPAAGSIATEAPAAPATDATGKALPKLVSGPARVSRVTVAAGPVGTWSTVVTAEQKADATSPLSRVKAVKPSSDAARYELVRDLQLELKRVGCFGGEISGAWGAGTKNAMTAFTERVNARLPISEPDYVLLALVKAHPAKACGDACPTGQAPSDSGRCVPKAVLAQAERRKAAQEKKIAAAAAKTQTSGWTTVTVAAPIEAEKRAPAPVAVAAALAAPPLPGRMSIGGPRTPAVPVTQSAPAPVPPPAAIVEAPATRVAAVDPVETAALPADGSEARPASVTGSAHTGPRVTSGIERAIRRSVRGGNPQRPYRVGRYVPPPPHMLGSFYTDKPAYTASRARW